MRTLRISLVAAVTLGLIGFAMPAMANTIYFVRDPDPSPNSVPVVKGYFNLVVQIQGQNSKDSDQCTINWNQTQCDVTNFPNKTKALVTVWERPGTTGSDPTVLYGRMSFWVKESTESSAGDQYIHIPTGSVTFSFSHTPNNRSQITLFPAQYMVYGNSYATPPNGGFGYTGVLVGQVGGTCSYSGCTVPLLAGCYSVVFRMGTPKDTGAVSVNSAFDSDTPPLLNTALCVGPGQAVNYQIQVP